MSATAGELSRRRFHVVANRLPVAWSPSGAGGVRPAVWPPLSSLVWVHDHHLLPVSQMLARERPDLVVGLSIDTPIEAMVLAGRPIAAELGEALTAPALIGVQKRRDFEALQRFCPSRRGGTLVSPASIDPVELTALAESRATRALIERPRTPFGSRLLVVGVDRIDYTKAIPQRMDAIEHLVKAP